MRSISRLAAVTTLAALVSSSAFAATVTGTVKGPDGAPYEGAFVVATNAKIKISQGRTRTSRGPISKTSHITAVSALRPAIRQRAHSLVIQAHPMPVRLIPALRLRDI